MQHSIKLVLINGKNQLIDGTPKDLSPIASMLGLSFFLLLIVAVASVGALFKPGMWYESLTKPAWTPPNWVFPIAWAILYLMIAFSGWLVWRVVGFSALSFAFIFYFSQLLLNAAWSWLFFGLHRMDLAFIDIVLLWITIVANIIAFHTIHPLASYLLVPYLAWVSYVAALNFTVWQLNT